MSPDQSSNMLPDLYCKIAQQNCSTYTSYKTFKRGRNSWRKELTCEHTDHFYTRTSVPHPNKWELNPVMKTTRSSSNGLWSLCASWLVIRLACTKFLAISLKALKKRDQKKRKTKKKTCMRWAKELCGWWPYWLQKTKHEDGCISKLNPMYLFLHQTTTLEQSSTFQGQKHSFLQS